MHAGAEAKYAGRGEGRSMDLHGREPVTPTRLVRLGARLAKPPVPDFSLTREIFHSEASLSSLQSGFYQETQAIRSVQSWVPYTTWSQKILQGVLRVQAHQVLGLDHCLRVSESCSRQRVHCVLDIWKTNSVLWPLHIHSWVLTLDLPNHPFTFLSFHPNCVLWSCLEEG